jgi:hypothetical protein
VEVEEQMSRRVWEATLAECGRVWEVHAGSLDARTCVVLLGGICVVRQTWRASGGHAQTIRRAACVYLARVVLRSLRWAWCSTGGRWRFLRLWLAVRRNGLRGLAMETNGKDVAGQGTWGQAGNGLKADERMGMCVDPGIRRLLFQDCYFRTVIISGL